MPALFPKVPKSQRAKALEIDDFDYLTVVCCPFSREGASNLYCEKLESFGYILAADSFGLSSLKFYL